MHKFYQHFRKHAQENHQHTCGFISSLIHELLHVFPAPVDLSQNYVFSHLLKVLICAVITKHDEFESHAMIEFTSLNLMEQV